MYSCRHRPTTSVPNIKISYIVISCFLLRNKSPLKSGKDLYKFVYIDRLLFQIIVIYFLVEPNWLCRSALYILELGVLSYSLSQHIWRQNYQFNFYFSPILGQNTCTKSYIEQFSKVNPRLGQKPKLFPLALGSISKSPLVLISKWGFEVYRTLIFQWTFWHKSYGGEFRDLRLGRVWKEGDVSHPYLFWTLPTKISRLVSCCAPQSPNWKMLC